MALRFFADHCVASSISAALQQAGYEVFTLRDHLPTDAADPVVIAKAQELDAILLSLNGDFADIVAYPPANFGGIIAMQIRNNQTVAALVAARLINHLRAYPDRADYAGTLLIVEPHRIRIHG